MPAYLDSLAPLRWLCAVIPFAAVNTVGLYALAGAARFRALIGVVTLNLTSHSTPAVDARAVLGSTGSRHYGAGGADIEQRGPVGAQRTSPVEPVLA